MEHQSAEASEVWALLLQVFGAERRRLPAVAAELGMTANAVRMAKSRVLRRLREEYESKGRLRLFENLSNYLTGERADASYADLAANLGIPESAVKKQLHNMRQRYRWLLRDEVAHTVENPAEVDDEIRHLCAALAAANA